MIRLLSVAEKVVFTNLPSRLLNFVCSNLTLFRALGFYFSFNSQHH